MGASQSDFQEHFASLSDEALLDVRREDLVAAAQAVYDEEIRQRGLADSHAHETPNAGGSGGNEELVNVVEFESAEDAGQALEQLKKAGIPAYVAIAVPETFARQAVALLDPGVSDEELAALAEGAKGGS